MTDIRPIAVSVEVGATLIDCSPTTLRGYIEQGLIPSIKFPSAKNSGTSRRVMVAVADLEAFVLQNRITDRAR